MKEYSIAQLSAPGLSAAMNVSDVIHHSVAAYCTAVATNVVLRLRGSLDGTNYFTVPLTGNTAVTGLTVSGNQATISADGAYLLFSEAALNYIKLEMVSESGGTSTTVDAHYLGL